jgi:hypothetical protein
MFESVVPDPGEDGLKRAARIFHVVSVLIVITTLVGIALRASGESIQPLRIVLSFALAAVAYFTGRGIEERMNWAKWSGVILGVLELFNFPIGTVIGVAVLIYLRRAIRAGLFAPVATERTAPDPPRASVPGPPRS